MWRPLQKYNFVLSPMCVHVGEIHVRRMSEVHKSAEYVRRLYGVSSTHTNLIESDASITTHRSKSEETKTSETFQEGNGYRYKMSQKNVPRPPAIQLSEYSSHPPPEYATEPYVTVLPDYGYRGIICTCWYRVVGVRYLHRHPHVSGPPQRG